MRSRLSTLARHHLAPILLYLTLALLMTWPLATQPFTAVPGNAYDSWQNMWNMWWLKQALLTGQNPYFTPMLYYPNGANLFLQTLNPINFLISLPVHAVFGLVIAYNFVVLFSLTASGYTAYLLANDITGDRRAALIGGASFALCAFLLAQVMGGHTHMMAAEWLPLAMLAMRRAGRAPGVGATALAGLLLAINVLCDWQYFLFIMLWGGWYMLALAWEQRRVQAAVPLALALGVAVVLVSPLVIGTARLAAATPTASTEGGENFRREQSADVADFFIPSQLHPLWGLLAEEAQSYKPKTHIQNKTAYLGLVTVVLAALGLRRRESGFWLLTAVIFAVLAMGPTLQTFGTVTHIPLPGAIIFELPLLNVFRYPIRYIIITMLALAMLAAMGAQRLLARLDSREQRPRFAGSAVIAGLIALLALDNLTTPFPLVGVYVPPIYEELAQDSEEYAILDAPFYYFTSPVYMLYQAVHNKPLVGGYTSRRLDYPLMDQMPIIRELAYAAPAPDIIAQDYADIAPSVFSYFNIRYLMLHSDGGALRYNEMQRIAEAAAGDNYAIQQGATIVAPDARGASWLRRTFGRASMELSGSMLIYKVQPPADPQPFLGVGTGWDEPTRRIDGAMQRRLNAEEGELVIYSAMSRPATLEIYVYSYREGELALSMNGNPLPPIELAAGQHRLRIPLAINAGATSLTLRPAGTGLFAMQRAAIKDE